MLTQGKPRESPRPIHDFSNFKKLRRALKESNVHVRKVERAVSGKDKIIIDDDTPAVFGPQNDILRPVLEARGKS